LGGENDNLTQTFPSAAAALKISGGLRSQLQFNVVAEILLLLHQDSGASNRDQ
jgi:hypothetical protein